MRRLGGRRNVLNLTMVVLLLFLVYPALLCAAREAGSPKALRADSWNSYRVFAFNDLGMHCYDSDFSVFAILPPFNVLHSQVLLKQSGHRPYLVNGDSIVTSYSAIADGNGSINTTSAGGKTNFWDYILTLFGVSQPVNVGILGAQMPGPGNTPQMMTYDPSMYWFSATGVPVTYLDDLFQPNAYPLMRIQALDKDRGNSLAALDIVVPVSSEMNCASCHETGMDAASTPNGSANFHGLLDSAWSQNPDPTIRYRENILTLHDAMNGTQLMNSRPVLCASCHYSKALDLNNVGPQGVQNSHLFLSLAIHRHHGTPAGPGANTNQGVIPIPEPGTGPSVATCYYCHPGNDTQCLRSVMATNGMICQNCHGGLLAVGGVYPLATGAVRRPWVDMPKCQACHTGDALSHLGNTYPLQLAYNANDPAATPVMAVNQRFAENQGALYRFSLGHGNMACEACHGSTHAEWPARTPGNDDITAVEIQGHTGPILECTACHGSELRLSLKGPHGLHNVNDTRWLNAHGMYYKRNGSSCRACHGLNLEGTVLTRVPVDRTWSSLTPPVVVPAGTAIHCAMCHRKPGSIVLSPGKHESH